MFVDVFLELLIFVLSAFLIVAAGGTFYVWWNGHHKPESHNRHRIHYRRYK